MPEIAEAVEEEADDLARTWLNQTRVARKGLSDERQAEYDRLEGMSTQPERISLTPPKAAQAETMVREKDGTKGPLETRLMHLMAAEDGTYPITLNEWERKVLDSEARQPGFKGWYRNPARATKESLAIAYKEDTGTWKAVRPDFIFFGTDHTGRRRRPRGPPRPPPLHAPPKLRGLAAFARSTRASSAASSPWPRPEGPCGPRPDQAPRSAAVRRQDR